MALTGRGRKPSVQDFDRTVIVAMAVVWVVESPVDEIVNVIAVGDRLVTTAGAVHVVTAFIDFTATVRVFRTEFHRAAVHVIRTFPHAQKPLRYTGTDRKTRGRTY